MTSLTSGRPSLLSPGTGVFAIGDPNLSPAYAGQSHLQPGGAPPWHSRYPALSGAFEPVFDERDDAELPIRGEIPNGLSGVFMRNGPNPCFEPDPRYAYPFDGTGMIHAILFLRRRLDSTAQRVTPTQLRQFACQFLSVTLLVGMPRRQSRDYGTTHIP